MNRLLNATAIAAALAIAGPALAQAPTTNPAATPSTTAPSYTQSAPSSTTQAAPYTQQTPAPSTTQPATQTAPYAQRAPMQPAPSAMAPAPSSAAEAASEPAPRHVLRRAHRRGYAERTRRTRGTRYTSTATRSQGMRDNIADQLNRQELSRASGGTTPPAGYTAPNTMQSYGGSYGQPSPTEGMPGAGQPSATSHPAGQMR